jgi:hypothetical protein
MQFALRVDEDLTTAVMDALVAAALVSAARSDGELSPHETARFDAEIMRVARASSDAEASAMVHRSRERILAISSRNALLEFLIGLADRLPDEAIRERTFGTIATITLADGRGRHGDGDVAPLMAVSSAFGITAQRAADLVRHARDALGH